MNGVLTMIQAATGRCGLGLRLRLREAGGCRLQAGRGKDMGYRISDMGFKNAESGSRKAEGRILGSLGRAGSMTPPAIRVHALSSQRGGLHRGRPTMAQSRGIQGRLNVFMQKGVRLSRFQSGSYAGGHSC